MTCQQQFFDAALSLSKGLRFGRYKAAAGQRSGRLKENGVRKDSMTGAKFDLDKGKRGGLSFLGPFEGGIFLFLLFSALIPLSWKMGFRAQ
jgi:hypothetical protein